MSAKRIEVKDIKINEARTADAQTQPGIIGEHGYAQDQTRPCESDNTWMWKNAPQTVEYTCRTEYIPIERYCDRVHILDAVETAVPYIVIVGLVFIVFLLGRVTCECPPAPEPKGRKK